MSHPLPEPIAVTLLVIDVLEQLNIPYIVGGCAEPVLNMAQLGQPWIATW